MWLFLVIAETLSVITSQVFGSVFIIEKLYTSFDYVLLKEERQHRLKTNMSLWFIGPDTMYCV